jgi:osomolarity two-component system, sensor histidine kinase TcsA
MSVLAASPGTSAVDGVAEEVFALNPISTVLLDPSLRIQKASNSFLESSALSGKEWHGMSFLGVLEKYFSLSQTEVRRIQDIINVALRIHKVQISTHSTTETTQHLRVVPIVKDDSLCHLVIEWQPVARLDTGQKLIGSGLSTTEAFRVLVEAVKDYAIFLLDTQGYIVTWNAGAELSKGYKPHEIIGKHFSVFYGPEDLKADKPRRELEICLRDGRVQDEGWRYRKDGTRFWANVVITTIYDNDVHVGFGKVTRDLTERIAAESQLIAAYEESANLKSEFLANMSHEIRTPMHGVLSANTLLLDTHLTDQQRDLVNIIDDSGKIMLQIINDILDYSKLSSGSFSLSSDIVGLQSIISSVLHSFQNVLKPTVHFELSLSPNLPKSAQGDPLRFRQIVQNLISNAVKFTERGYIRVHVSVQKEDESSYTIYTEVKDSGIGVSEQAKGSLFTPFSQFDNSKTKRYSGTGLGLSISKSLVDMMGGQIACLPNPDGYGTIFWFTIILQKIKLVNGVPDLTQEMDESLTISASDNSKTLKEIFEQKAILLAEDNIINQKVMLMTLRSLGFLRVDTATDGAQASRLAADSPKEYDLILMDINMPILDGIKSTAEIRSCGIKTPIIALTANALKGDREHFLSKGMNDYIPKPVDKVHLARVLKTWLT